MAIYEIVEEDLKEVNGGYMCSPNGTSKTVVVDDHTGKELQRFDNKMYAHMYCEQNGISTRWITNDQLERLRRGEQI